MLCVCDNEPLSQNQNLIVQLLLDHDREQLEEEEEGEEERCVDTIIRLGVFQLRKNVSSCF